MHRLVTFLGKPSKAYCETTHTWEGQKLKGRTRYSAVAIAKALKLPRDESEVIVLCTEDAWTSKPQGQPLPQGKELTQQLQNLGLKVLKPCLLTGRYHSEDIWKDFETLHRALTPGQGYQQLVIDITHGFRAQPLVLAAVLALAISTDSPELPEEVRVMYAAFEPRSQQKNSPTPIWDLTPMISLMRWAHALGVFIRTGQGEEAVRIVAAAAKERQKHWAVEKQRQGPQPSLPLLASALKRFSADLAALRTPNLLGVGSKQGSAQNLLGAIEQTRGEIEAELKPLKTIMDRLVQWLKPLASAPLGIHGSEKAVAALAELYLGFNRYLEAAATLREGWINLVVTPKGVTDPNQRRQAENRHYSLLEGYIKSIQQLRNDLLHAGYRLDAITPGNVKKRLKYELGRYQDCAPEVLEKLAREPEPEGPAVFVNISNHPSSSWDEAQTKAALELGEQIVDIPFPQVPPGASIEKLQELAKGVIAQLPTRVGAAMVMGEMRLLVVLLKRLQSMGIRCVAATTIRDVEEKDGVKITRFHFQGFADYPLIA